VTAALFMLAAVVAVGDWAAVWRRWFRVEFLAKPLVLALLLAAAATADLPVIKSWVVAALVFGLLGDIALMLSTSATVDARFLLGLAAFLAGHVCYLAAFARYGVRVGHVLVGVAVVVVVAAATLPFVLRRTWTIGGEELTAAVGAYAGVLGAMTALALGTTLVLTAIGGVLFLLSDTVLAWHRFVRAFRWAPLLVAVSYHLAQGLIVLGLIRGSS
jgi:uncharacterized membrane protein YhhN